MYIEAGAPFTQAAIQFGDREAVRDDTRTASYSQLREAANKVGSGLLAHGLGQGARVAVLSYNSIEVVELWLGLERANLVRVVMHSHFEMPVHVRTLEDVAATVLVFDWRFADEIDAHRKEMHSVKTFVCVGGETPEWAISYESLLAKGTTADLRINVDENDPSFLQLTSGTTGHPKPWAHSHRSFRAVVANNLEHLDTFSTGIESLGQNDVNLHFHALQWATGFQTLMPYLLRGSKSIVMDDSSFEPKAVADLIVSEGVTGTLIPAPMLPPILDELEARNISSTDMKRMVIFFATPDLLERTTRVLGPVWCHGFGSTEQGAPTTRLRAEDVTGHPKRLESVGRAASPFFELAVVDEKGERLPTGSVGEIVVRSAMSAGSYWELPEKTKEVYFLNDWLRPEDIGYVDGDGYLFYLDRAKDRITTTEGVVYPHVIETAILLHECVDNCGVFGIGKDGAESVIAVVTLKPDAEQSTGLANEIIAFVGKGLASHERPSTIIVVEELPTVLGGAKVQREVLRNSFIAENGGAV